MSRLRWLLAPIAAGALAWLAAPAAMAQEDAVEVCLDKCDQTEAQCVDACKEDVACEDKCFDTGVTCRDTCEGPDRDAPDDDADEDSQDGEDDEDSAEDEGD